MQHTRVKPGYSRVNKVPGSLIALFRCQKAAQDLKEATRLPNPGITGNNRDITRGGQKRCADVPRIPLFLLYYMEMRARRSLRYPIFLIILTRASARSSAQKCLFP